MNSIKLTYINYLQMLKKFMSSGFFVWCFIVVNFEEIWTRPYRDVMIWWTKYNKKWSISTFRETYIYWNWLDQAWGRFYRDALYEMKVCTRCEVWSILKMLLKLASKCWVDDLNEICWSAFSVCWPKMFLVLHLLRSFLKNICANIPGCVWPFESWCVGFVYIPGCVWYFMSCFLLYWLTPLKLTLKKWWISSQILQKFSSFLEWLKLFSLIFGIVVVVMSTMMMQINSHGSWKRIFCANWKTCSWYWLLESFRRHYEGPLTEVLLKLKWMIEKLIQDNVVVLRTIHSFCQKIKFVLLHDEVECKCWICLRGNC